MAEIDPKAEVLKPKRVSVDGQSVEQRSIEELKQAMSLSAQQSARRTRKLPIRFVRFANPGSV
jgi:hypothetical protein